MPAYRDKDRNTWYSSFKYKDWSGKSKSKTKRGFATKKEAQNWESQFKLRESHELDMRFDEFYKLYLEYCQKRLKVNTVKTKDQIFTFHILPFFEEKRMNEITPAMITAWQNVLLDERDDEDRSYSMTYDEFEDEYEKEDDAEDLQEKEQQNIDDMVIDSYEEEDEE